MGCYDTFGKEQVQLKVSGSNMKQYNVGDEVTINDGIYLAYEGAVVVLNRKVTMVTTKVSDKWGGLVDLTKVADMNNPLIPFIEKLANQKERKNKMKRKLWRWNTIIDEQTCDECLQRHGNILSNEEQVDEIGPPLHKPTKENPRGCRCYITEVKINNQ